VVELAKMGDLVGGEIVEHERRRHDEAPGEGQHARRRAGAPAGRLIAHDDALGSYIEVARMHDDARIEIAARLLCASTMEQFLDVEPPGCPDLAS